MIGANGTSPGRARARQDGLLSAMAGKERRYTTSRFEALGLVCRKVPSCNMPLYDPTGTASGDAATLIPPVTKSEVWGTTRQVGH